MTWLRSLIKSLRPWPAPSERRADLQRARSEHEQSRARLAEATTHVRALNAVVYEQNHIADLIARQVRGGARR